MILLNPNGGFEGCGPIIIPDPVTAAEFELNTKRTLFLLPDSLAHDRC